MAELNKPAQEKRPEPRPHDGQMADMNKQLANVQERETELKRQIRNLLGTYEDLYKESNRTLMSQRVAARGNMDGLEEFYRLVQTVRRNRDVVGSMMRGVENLRPLSEFRFIEEDVADTLAATEKRKKASEARKVKRQVLVQQAQEPAPVVPSEVTPQAQEPVATGEPNGI